MHVLSAVGPDAADLIARLAPALDGRVATVGRLDGDRPVPSDADAEFALSSDGAWRGAGEGRTLGELLDSLAPDYDYALVADRRVRRGPTVAVGGTAADADETVPSAAEADLDALAALLDRAEPLVTLESLVRRAKDSPRADRAGAIATFTGRVRARDDADDAPTVSLEFEKYEGVAEERMNAISEELRRRDGVQEVYLHHRTGVIEDGEDIVFVVVLAGHRGEAFRTVEDGINRLKDEVPIFKKETTVEEEFWVHDR